MEGSPDEPGRAIKAARVRVKPVMASMAIYLAIAGDLHPYKIIISYTKVQGVFALISQSSTLVYGFIFARHLLDISQYSQE
jgi:hypothetical protein